MTRFSGARSPDGWNAGGSYLGVSANDRDAKIHRRGRYDAVGHVRHGLPRNESHGLNDFCRERNFFQNVIGVLERSSQIGKGRSRYAILLDQVHDLCQADWSEGYSLIRCGSFVKEVFGHSRKSWVTIQKPQCRVRVGDACDHQTSRPKFRNISRRFSSISSAEGAGPYLANMPYPVSRGLTGLSCATTGAT